MADKTDLPIDIRPQLKKRLEVYEKLSFFEQYAMFMGKAQILELGLKRVLTDKFDYDFETMEKWTLGKLSRKLEKEHIRPDFLVLLNSVVEYRNFIAHEMLAAEAMISALLDGSIFTKNQRQLGKAIYEIEQIILHFDLNQEHDGWLPVDGEKEGA